MFLDQMWAAASSQSLTVVLALPPKINLINLV